MRRQLASIALILGALSSALPAAAVTICGIEATPEQVTAANGLVSTGIISNTGQLSCVSAEGVDDAARSRGCVSAIFCAEPGAICCAPGLGGRVGSNSSDAAETATDDGGFMSLRLPGCTASGNCTLDDIVKTGVSFANFLFGISGAILLATFVYGGVLYLTAGSGGNVSKAKDMIKNALIGMILVFGAGALVTTIYDTFRSGGGGSSGSGPAADTCATEHPGPPAFSCQTLAVPASDEEAIAAEVARRGCFRRLCTGPTNRVCCPPTP